MTSFFFFLSFFFLEEYVLPTRVQMNFSDKKLLCFNIETSHQLFLRFSVYKVVWRSTHCHKPF